MDAECGFHTEPNGSDLLGLHGPTILVDIGFDPAFQPGNDAVPVAAITNMPALVDTGASETYIDTALATALGLPIVDQETSAEARDRIPSTYTSLKSTFPAWSRRSGGVSPASI